jgi:hypothetical protein
MVGVPAALAFAGAGPCCAYADPARTTAAAMANAILLAIMTSGIPGDDSKELNLINLGLLDATWQ